MRARVAGMEVRISREVCVPGKRACVQGTKDEMPPSGAAQGTCGAVPVEDWGWGARAGRLFTTPCRKYFPVLLSSMEWSI